MHIQVIAIGTRTPDWVQSGYNEYAARLPREWRLELIEIGSGKRTKNQTPAELVRKEGERLLGAVNRNARIIALDAAGKHWDTPTLANRLAQWLQERRDLALVIGGPDGLDERVKTQADDCWSLSQLIFPHALVRILVAEQLYRAWSIINNRPYHRA